MKTLNFKTNIQLKSIIGKDLINDDNIAILELVKNSFDADAKKVEVVYKNLKDNDDKTVAIFSENTSRLIIRDDGLGMDIDDFENKWLNIAYSEKKSNNRQHNRMMAGAKGVGRFSCDRLGEYLNLYARKKGSNEYILLKIDWKKFEIEDDKKEIQSVNLEYEYLSETDLKNRKIPSFEHGVLLEIIKLRSNWVYEAKDKSNKSNWNTDKLVNLKKYLEKLINPNQAFEKNDFGIYLNAPEFVKENDKKDAHEKFIGKVENSIFEKLDFRTTSIESEIIEGGKVVLTTLKDKGQIIFWIKEKNSYYPLIKNAKINFYYLNPYSKAFFTKQTGIQSVNYGSIFLFINGFRIPPYGEVGDDWLGLDQRKNQGTARYIGLREIVGSIEILDKENDFKIVSSREGIVKNDNYQSLTNSKNNDSYVFKTYRRLEKYVVDGLAWDSIPENDKNNLSDIAKKIISGETNEDDLVYREDDLTKKRRIYESIHSIIGARIDNVIELYINEDLILNKIEEEKLNAEREFEQLITDFNNKKIDGDALNRILQKKAIENKDLEKQISDFSKYTTNEATTKAIAELQHYKETINKQTKIIEELQLQLQNEKSEREKQLQEIENLKSLKDKAENFAVLEVEKRVKAEKETEKVKGEKDVIQEQLITEQKKGAFQGALIGTDKERIIGLQHQIFHSSARINRSLDLLLKHLGASTIDDKTSKYIKLIALESSKINSIANFVTKANFNLKASEIKTDIIDFIKGYINEIYLFDDKIIKIQMKIIFKDRTNQDFVKEFKPLEITTIVDNFISNAEKAGATELIFNFSEFENILEIDIMDNGIGISEENISKIFDLGYTTTNGSGIGLFQTYDIIKNSLKGKISVSSVKDKSTNFKIILK
jgi:signal transduction histidine kinase